MVRRHGKLIFLGLLLITFCGNLFAQKIPVTVPIDSLITVGYATGSLKTISGSVEKITERQMNKDQITNPLEAIRGRVPRSDHPTGNERACRPRRRSPAGNDLSHQWQRPADHRRRSIRRP